VAAVTRVEAREMETESIRRKRVIVMGRRLSAISQLMPWFACLAMGFCVDEPRGHGYPLFMEEKDKCIPIKY